MMGPVHPDSHPGPAMPTLPSDDGYEVLDGPPPPRRPFRPADADGYEVIDGPPRSSPNPLPVAKRLPPASKPRPSAPPKPKVTVLDDDADEPPRRPKARAG